MTVLRSLRSRMLLARVAVQLPLTEAEDRLPGLVMAGIDMAVLTTGGPAEHEANLRILRNLERHLGQRGAAGVDTPEIDADVRVCLPGERGQVASASVGAARAGCPGAGADCRTGRGLPVPGGSRDASRFTAAAGRGGGPAPAEAGNRFPGSPRAASTSDPFRSWRTRASGGSGSPRAEPWRRWNGSTRSCGGRGAGIRPTRTTWGSRSGFETPHANLPRIASVRFAYPYV